jgi:gliding motility-associated lipoprotein GldJ
MGGNVAEWVADVYRPIVDDEYNDFNYFRGNNYQKYQIGEDGKAVVATETQYTTLSNGKVVATTLPGELLKEDLDSTDLRARTQFDKSYNVNFRDGDYRSSRNYRAERSRSERAEDEEGETQTMYKSPDMFENDPEKMENNATTLISDQVRVYKGGSWKDRAYWLDPAQRRFYPQDQATDFIGFRCAMSRIGSKTTGKKKFKN